FCIAALELGGRDRVSLLRVHRSKQLHPADDRSRQNGDRDRDADTAPPSYTGELIHVGAAFDLNRRKRRGHLASILIGLGHVVLDFCVSADTPFCVLCASIRAEARCMSLTVANAMVLLV